MYLVVYLDAIAVQRWKSLKCTEVCGLHCANSRGNKILAFHLSIKKEGENITGYVFSALKWPQLMSFDMQTVSHILNHVTCQMQKLTLSDLANQTQLFAKQLWDNLLNGVVRSTFSLTMPYSRFNARLHSFFY